MKKSIFASSLIALGALAMATTAAAGTERYFETQQSVGQFDLTLHVMEVSAGEMHGKEHWGHNLKLRAVQGGAELAADRIQARIVHPNLQQQTVTLERMGEWYMASAPLNCIKGAHTITLDLGETKAEFLYF
jgi:hypothetical protein